METRFARMRKVLSFFIGLIFFFLLAMLFVNVILGYFFGYAFSWAEEVTMEGLIIVVFLGMPILSSGGKHIRVDLINNLVGKRCNQYLNSLYRLIETLVAIIICGASLDLILTIRPVAETLPASHLPIWLLMIVIPLAFILTAIVMVVNLVRPRTDKE